MKEYLIIELKQKLDKDIKELDGEDNYLVVGIISDKDAEKYKRKPIYDEENRRLLIESCKFHSNGKL